MLVIIYKIMNLRKTITLFISLIILVSCSKIGKPADFDYGKLLKTGTFKISNKLRPYRKKEKN